LVIVEWADMPFFNISAKCALSSAVTLFGPPRNRKF
jgi:hypothetical protein